MNALNTNPKRLKEAREKAKMNLEEVVDRVGLSKSTLSRYENGKVEIIKVPIIQKLAEIYKVNWLWLLNKSDNMEMSKDIMIKSANSVPLLGQIAAGTPILAEENIEDYFNIDYSIKADFALRIKGNSMIDANIHDGDIVFIKSQSTLENGEIGAVIINEEATLKRFYHQDGVIILRPENTDYDPIIVTDGNVRIAGRLSAVISLK